MKPLLIFLMFSFQTSFSQKDSTIYFKEFGWTINLPSGFKIVNAAPVHDLKNAGTQVTEIDLINARKGRANYFISSYTNTKGITADNWGKVDDSVRYVTFKTYQKQFSVVPDTSSSIVYIDGVKFKKTEAKYKDSDVSFRFSYLATFYRGYNFAIIYMYVDSVAGGQIIKMLNTSKFDK